jgi:hypothetical protein
MEITPNPDTESEVKVHIKCTNGDKHEVTVSRGNTVTQVKVRARL